MKGDLAALALLLLGGVVLYEAIQTEPDWGIEFTGIDSGKPQGHGWIDAGPGTAVTLTIEVDHNGDGKADEFWRSEAGGKVGVYWPVLPGLRYRALTIVNAEGYGPTHWWP